MAMFVTEKEEEFRKRLKAYINSRPLTEEIVAVYIDISTVTLQRFLEKKPVRKKTLLKIGEFLAYHEEAEQKRN